jgi:hypothetical protein
VTKHRDIFAALAAPFATQEVKTKPGGGGRQQQYVTARTVMNRLDAVLGPENWWDDYTPLEHSVICRLTVRLPDGQVVTKSDAGGEAGMADLGDNDKSGFSDAFKRAAVKWGVGRYLYRDGVANLADPPAPPAEAQIPATPPPVPPPAAPAAPRAGAEDAQGRGGKLVYGAASRRPQPKPHARPTTGEDLHYYAMDNTIDPGLSNWIINTHNPQGFPDHIINWTPDDVRRAWPSIREHLETVKAARLRMKASA